MTLKERNDAEYPTSLSSFSSGEGSEVRLCKLLVSALRRNHKLDAGEYKALLRLLLQIIQGIRVLAQQ